jgi:hypothetical protein
VSLKKWLYYLIEEDGRSNKVTAGGIVSSTGTPTPLNNTPDGWQKEMISWERNKARHGITRSYSADIQFVLDGATILRDFYTKNVERKLFLLIQRLGLEYTNTYFKWVYSFFYKGELDFTTIKDGVDSVKIGIMEGGVSKQLKANESTVYEIPFDDDAINVRMDGITLDEGAKYSVVDGVSIEKGLYGIEFFLPVSFINRESTLPYFAFVPQNLESIESLTWAQQIDSDNYLLKAADGNSSTVAVLIEGTLRFTCTQNDNPFGFKVRFIKSNQDIVDQNDYQIFSFTPVAGQYYEYPVNLTVLMAPGEKLHLEGIYFGGGTGAIDIKIEFATKSDLRFSYSQRADTTVVKAFRRSVLFRKLCAKVFGHEDYAVSTLLDADDRAVTSGDAIRGITDPVIKTSLADFYNDVDTDLMAGMGVLSGPATANLPAGQRLVIESREFFYDDTDPIDLGEIKDMEITYASDISFNTVKTGWKKAVTEDVNGKYDFNGANQFTSPIQSISREYGLVSPYKAGPYEIELTRISLTGKDSTDDKRDNDVYVLVVNETQGDEVATVSFIASGNLMLAPLGIEFAAGMKIRITGSASNDGEWIIQSVASLLFVQVIALDGPLVDEASVSVLIEFIEGLSNSLKRDTYDNQADPDDFGVPSPTTIFNIDLSPARKLRRHGRWIRSMLKGFDNKKLVFASGEMNTKLKTVQGSVTIAESADIAISSLGTRMCLPFYITVTANMIDNIAEIMEANPNRCFTWTENGVHFKGFNIKTGFAPNDRDEQTINLLSTADNDFTTRIH